MKTIANSNPTSPLRVVLVDDHPLALLAIRIALFRVSGLEVVAECDRGDESGSLSCRRAACMRARY